MMGFFQKQALGLVFAAMAAPAMAQTSQQHLQPWPDILNPAFVGLRDGCRGPAAIFGPDGQLVMKKEDGLYGTGTFPIFQDSTDGDITFCLDKDDLRARIKLWDESPETILEEDKFYIDGLLRHVTDPEQKKLAYNYALREATNARRQEHMTYRYALQEWEKYERVATGIKAGWDRRLSFHSGLTDTCVGRTMSFDTKSGELVIGGTETPRTGVFPVIYTDGITKTAICATAEEIDAGTAVMEARYERTRVAREKETLQTARRFAEAIIEYMPAENRTAENIDSILNEHATRASQHIISGDIRFRAAVRAQRDAAATLRAHESAPKPKGP